MSKSGGGGGGPSGQTTTTQQSSPWSGQVPYLSGTLDPNQRQYSSGAGTGADITQGTPGVLPNAAYLYSNYTPQYYPNSTVAPFNPTQQAGLGQQAAYGKSGGSSSVNSANNALTNFSNGNFLSAGNPYFQQMANSIGQAVSPIVNSQFAANGRYGSGANVNALTSNLTNTIGNLAGQNYQQGMQNMIQASALSPAVASGQQSAIQQTLDAGNTMQQQSQANINDQINRWNFQQQLPYNQLQQYAGLVGGNMGGGSSMLSQPYFGPSGGKGGSGGKSIGSTVATLAPLAIAAFAA